MDSRPSEAGTPWIDRVPVVRAGLAVTSLGAASIHFAVLGDHFAEYVAFGIFFSVVAWFQALWGLAVMVAPSRRLLYAGLAGNALVVAVWALSRSSGLPVGPEAGTPEPVAFLDALATVFELAVATAASVLLTRRRPVPASRGRRAMLAVAMLTVVLGVTTTAAIVTGVGHEESSHHSGATEHQVPP